MSKGMNSLHSHSLLEREVDMPKHFVLVDAEYKNAFYDVEVKPFRYAGVEYIKVPTLAFVNRGGTFKALMQ